MEKIKMTDYNVGELLKKNNAIFNYVYDKHGMRLGIVVATKGIGKHHPKIGWALFDEVECAFTEYKTFGSIPRAKRLLNELKRAIADTDNLIGNCLIREIERYDVSQGDLCYMESRPLTQKAKYELFELALSRGNFDSWGFYCDKNVPVVKNANLREDTIAINEVWTNKDGHTEKQECVYQDAETANALRSAIRDLEYRAWRYYK